MSDVNSRDYWNTRFETDWTLRRGCEQSRFFANIALGLMPDWLVRALRAGATVCDWGCAMGDGTAALAAALPGAKFTGIDFSSAAIEHATRHHPAVRFACRDLLQEAPAERFDVLFSSNVLEHFPQPDDVLGKLAAHTGAVMVHLVPFREPLANREPEHTAAFDWQDLRLQPLPGWRLVHAAAVDVRNLPGSLWAGEQILFVFARDGHRLDLSLASVRIDSQAGEQEHLRLVAAAHAAEVARLETSTRVAADAMAAERAASAAHVEELRRRLDLANHELRTQNAANTALHDRLAAALAEQARLHAELGATLGNVDRCNEQLRRAQAELAAIRGSRIWRWTAPIRRGN
jgi:Methyltransferase domain